MNWFVLPLLLLCLVGNCCAEPFKRARLRKVVGDPDEIYWSRNDIIRTGPRARAELEFQDSTLVRLGSNTRFRFIPNTRDAFLDAGVILFHAAKRTGPVRLQTANLTISGFDFLVSNVDGRVKTIGLKRRVSIYFTANPKIHVLGEAQMLDIPRGATVMPKRVEINLDKLIATSLLGEAGGFDPFPSHAATAIDVEGSGSGFSNLAIRQTSQAIRLTESADRIAAGRQAAQQQAIFEARRAQAARQLEAQKAVTEAARQLEIQRAEADRLAATQEARRREVQIQSSGSGQGQGGRQSQGQGPSQGQGQDRGNQGRHLGQLK